MLLTVKFMGVRMPDPTIIPENYLVLTRSVLYLRTLPGKRAALVDGYRELRVLEDALEQDGCLGCELQLSLEDPDLALVTALWRDADAYAGWIANPARERARSTIEQLVEGAIEGTLFDIALQVGRSGLRENTDSCNSEIAMSGTHD